MLISKIKELEERIKTGKLIAPDDYQLWGGADVVITDEMTTELKNWQNDSHLVIGGGNGNVSMSSRRVVCSKYAKELSMIFEELKVMFYDFIDSRNKYDFYGSLAEAGIRALKSEDGINVLLETVKEAEIIAKDIDSKFTYYFAYGSNMDENQMVSRCPGASFIGKAKLNDYRFIINERGVASIVEEKGSKVEGILWVITKSDESKLDGYEGVSKGYYYKKDDLNVTTLEYPERNISPLIYIASNQNIGKPRDGYLTKIINSAEKYKFSSEYIEKIRSFQ